MSVTPGLVSRRRAAIEHPVTAVLAGGVLFGTAGVAQSFAPAGASPVAVGAVRLSVGALVLAVYVIARGGSLRGIVEHWRARLMVLAALGAASYQPFFFGGIQRAGVPLGTLVAVGSAPVFTGLLSWAVLRERPTRAWALATAVCVGGLALLTGVSVAEGSVVGVALSAGAGGSIACYSVAAKRMLTRGVPLLELCASSFLLGSLVMVPLAGVLGLGWVATVPGALVALYLGVLTMGVANVLYARGLGQLPAASAATLTLADPLTATLLGAVLLSQVLAPVGVLGLAVLAGGLVLQGIASTRQHR